MRPKERVNKLKQDAAVLANEAQRLYFEISEMNLYFEDLGQSKCNFILKFEPKYSEAIDAMCKKLRKMYITALDITTRCGITEKMKQDGRVKIRFNQLEDKKPTTRRKKWSRSKAR